MNKLIKLKKDLLVPADFKVPEGVTNPKFIEAYQKPEWCCHAKTIKIAKGSTLEKLELDDDVQYMACVYELDGTDVFTEDKKHFNHKLKGKYENFHTIYLDEKDIQGYI